MLLDTMEQYPERALPILAFLWLCVFFLLFCFHLTLIRMQKAVAGANQKLSPASIWWGLVPGVNIIWNLLLVPKLAKSLEDEYHTRGWSQVGEDFGRSTGRIWTWGSLGWLVCWLFREILLPKDTVHVEVNTVINGFGLVTCFFWLCYWAQMSYYGRGLSAARRNAIRDDYDDDYQPPDNVERTIGGNPPDELKQE